jgi:hypothetical protein
LCIGSQRHIGKSSNGRTPDSDSGYLGSNPSFPAINRMPLEASSGIFHLNQVVEIIQKP